MLLSEHTVPSPQGQTAMDHLLSSVEEDRANLEQQNRDEKDGTAPVPKVARLLRDGQGKFMYIGDSASLSFLQTVRRIVSSSIGRCEFTEDTSRHSMLEAFQSNPSTQPTSLIPPPRNEEAQHLARQYILASRPLLDLFDLNEFHPRLANWVENPSGDEDTVSSIFYLVLAIGSQVSNTNQTLAEQYFVSGRQLAFSAFTETPSLYTIQSYVLISMYMLGACRRNGAFMNLGIAVRAAYAVGIHRKDANTLFCARERRARERVWKSLRMVDLFLSASLGRPPATSEYDYDVHENPATLENQHQNSAPDEQVSLAVIALCRIFERILTDVYMKQVISINVAETISNQHRTWVRGLPTFLKQQVEPGQKSLEDALAAAQIFGSFYWSIILLTRPFLIYRVSQYVKSKTEASDPSETRASNSRIALFADACVYSALRALDIVDGLCQYTSLPRRLPFLINSVFNSAIVIGAASFADYDNLLPLEEGLNKAEKFLNLFLPHDPHACRFFQIIKYLRGAVTEYIRRRNRQWMNRRSKQVDQLFGQVGCPTSPIPASGPTPNDTPFTSTNQPAPSPTSTSPDKFPNPAPHPHPPQSSTPYPNPDPGTTPATSTASLQNPPSIPGPAPDIWDALYPSTTTTSTSPNDIYDTTALTTSGIPVGFSPGGTTTTNNLGTGLPPDAIGGRSQTPLSDLLLQDNGMLFAAEDLPVFGIGWDGG